MIDEGAVRITAPAVKASVYMTVWYSYPMLADGAMLYVFLSILACGMVTVYYSDPRGGYEHHTVPVPSYPPPAWLHRLWTVRGGGGDDKPTGTNKQILIETGCMVDGSRWRQQRTSTALARVVSSHLRWIGR